MNKYQFDVFKKRCLSDLQAEYSEDIFHALPLQGVPANLKVYIDGQGESAIAKMLPKTPENYLKIFAFQYLIHCFNSKD